jgi:hypothetical protein
MFYLPITSSTKGLPVLRKLSAATVGAALLGLTVLPAYAAPVSKLKVHNFTVPSPTGIKAWGSYSFSGGKADITVCVKESASDVDLATVQAVALNAYATKYQSIVARIAGMPTPGEQACKSMVTRYTTTLYVIAVSGTTDDDKAHIGKSDKIY